MWSFARLLGRLLFAAFLVIPLVEIALFILLGNAIGLWPTLAGVLLTAVVGSVVLRFQGVALLNEIRGAMTRGLLPAKALAEAMMVAIGGVLLLTPGYFTDALGLLILVPPVRSAIYHFARARLGAAGVADPTDRAGERPDTIELSRTDWRNL
jgi:UPF0716 protein FxsA